MRDRVFFDTNVLVYAVLQNDIKMATAKSLLHDGGLISVQVLNEFAAVARRKLKWTWPDIRTALTDFQNLCPNPLPIGIATQAIAVEIAAADGIVIYDALIVAAALEARCTTLLSEDMQHGRVIDGRLTIRNPFADTT